MSTNAGGYVAILTGTPGAVGITGTVSSNNIPRGASVSSLQTGSFTDSGTAVSTSSSLTITGVTSLNDTLVLASGTAANNTATFANGSGATVGAAGSGVLIYDNTAHAFDVSVNGGAYVQLLTSAAGAITGTVANNNIPKTSARPRCRCPRFLSNGTSVSTTEQQFTTSGGINTTSGANISSAGFLQAGGSIYSNNAGSTGWMMSNLNGGSLSCS